MQNDMLAKDPFDPAPCLRPDVTAHVTRGAMRLLADMGYAGLTEFHLPNGRRADLAGLNPKGHLLIIEVKSCREDFAIDMKWPDYIEYCDMFFFAVSTDFPQDILPENEGLILADQFGGAMCRNARENPLAAARRKALTLAFARQAACRLARSGTAT
ncbi:DNA repair putative endonuclease MmcB [Parvularcula sp. IMCC14364]|uniref:DNA repair putative endonuclease MmcB n=1 Tax=Parvularcula sp. IMCC14364 TaxID=3067902 RepID=UPI00274267AE|nr:DNA repair putative endonuclease MmcB [Parvularcula sp. IMCC14364]